MILNLPCEPCPSITSSPAKVLTLPILPCPDHESVVSETGDVIPAIHDCVFCDTIFPSKYSFAKHMITCMPELFDQTCGECPNGKCTYNEVSHGKCSCCLACQNITIRELSSDKDNDPNPLI